MNIGNFIKNKRKEVGLTQIQLAKGICNQGTISQLENKNKVPSVTTLNKLCNRLEIDFQDLMRIMNEGNNYDNELLLRNTRNLIFSREFVRANDELKKVNKNDSNFEMIESDYYLYKGILLYRDDKIEDAIFYINLALQKITPLNNHVTQLLCKTYLGIIYFKKEDITKSRIYMDECKKLIDMTDFDMIDYEDHINWIIYNVVNFYSKIKEIDTAIYLAKFGIQQAKKNNLIKNTEYLYYVLAYNDEKDRTFNANMSYYFSSFNDNNYLTDKILQNFKVLIQI